MREGIYAAVGLTFICGFIAMMVVQFTGGFYPDYSTGFRSGILMKSSTKGLLCKTVEGELVLGGFGSRAVPQTNAQGQMGLSNVWAFTASDPAVLKRLDELAGQNVKLKYRQWWIKPFCHETEYEVISVDPA